MMLSLTKLMRESGDARGGGEMNEGEEEGATLHLASWHPRWQTIPYENHMKPIQDLFATLQLVALTRPIWQMKPIWNPYLEVAGGVQHNTYQIEAVYGHSLIINPSPGIYQEIHPYYRTIRITSVKSILPC